MIVALVSAPRSKHSIVAATVSTEAPKSSAFTTMRTACLPADGGSDGPQVHRGRGQRAGPESDGDDHEEEERALDEVERVEDDHARSEAGGGDAARHQEVTRLTAPPAGCAGEFEHASPDEPDDRDEPEHARRHERVQVLVVEDELRFRRAGYRARRQVAGHGLLADTRAQERRLDPEVEARTVVGEPSRSQLPRATLERRDEPFLREERLVQPAESARRDEMDDHGEYEQ